MFYPGKEQYALSMLNEWSVYSPSILQAEPLRSFGLVTEFLRSYLQGGKSQISIKVRIKQVTYRTVTNSWLWTVSATTMPPSTARWALVGQRWYYRDDSYFY